MAEPKDGFAETITKGLTAGFIDGFTWELAEESTNVFTAGFSERFTKGLTAGS